MSASLTNLFEPFFKKKREQTAQNKAWKLKRLLSPERVPTRCLVDAGFVLKSILHGLSRLRFPCFNQKIDGTINVKKLQDSTSSN